MIALFFVVSILIDPVILSAYFWFHRADRQGRSQHEGSLRTVPRNPNRSRDQSASEGGLRVPPRAHALVISTRLPLSPK